MVSESPGRNASEPTGGPETKQPRRPSPLPLAKRVNDNDVLHLLKAILKASGKRGVPQGGVISPLLSNIYLNEVDKMLERAKEYTRRL